MNFPRTHEDRSNIKPIQALDANGEIESVKAHVIAKKLIPTRSPKKLYEITIEDEEGSQAVISLFNNPWAFKSYEVGQWYIITGKVVFEYRKIIFRHPDATKTAPPTIDETEELQDDFDKNTQEETIHSPLQDLEKTLYSLTKNNKYQIDDDNLLYLEFLKKELSDAKYGVITDTDRSLFILKDGQNYLLAPKAGQLSITDAYLKLKDYCQQKNIS